MQNSRHIRPVEECFWVKREYFSPGKTDPKGVQVLPIILLGPVRRLTMQWVTSMKRSCLFLIGQFELKPDLHYIFK